MTPEEQSKRDSLYRYDYHTVANPDANKQQIRDAFKTKEVMKGTHHIY